MAWTPSSAYSSDDEPLFRVQGYPVGVTEFLVGLYSAFFIALALSASMGHAAWGALLAYSSTDVLKGEVWRLVTYPLCNTWDRGIWFALEMALGLYGFGRQVERALGRRSFVILYLGLAVLPALLFLGISLATGTSFFLAGSTPLHFALFLSFALLFPDSRLFLGLITKWTALVLLAVYTLVDMAHHAWVDLGWMWAGAVVAAFAIRIPFLSRLGEWAEERRERAEIDRRIQQAAAKREAEEQRHQSIDPILEKISREGMQSLTKGERAVLENARLELLKREQRK